MNYNCVKNKTIDCPLMRKEKLKFGTPSPNGFTCQAHEGHCKPDEWCDDRRTEYTEKG